MKGGHGETSKKYTMYNDTIGIESALPINALVCCNRILTGRKSLFH